MIAWAVRLWRGAHALSTRRTLAREIDEELQSHILYATEELVARGVPIAEARRQALVAFGGVQQTREWVLRERALGWWLDAVRDTRIAARRLRKEPWSSIAIVLVVAVGIACVTSVFSLVNAAWLRPLPYAAVHELTLLHGISPTRFHSPQLPLALVPELRARATGVAKLAVFDERQTTLRANGTTVRVNHTRIDDATLALLRVVPVRGRAPTKLEYETEAPVALVSDSLWRVHIASMPSSGDTTMDIGGTRHRVIGVLPPDFHFPERSVVWTPMAMHAAMVRHERTPRAADDSLAFVQVIARLARGMTRDSLARRYLTDRRLDTNSVMAASGWRVRPDDVVDRGRSTAGFSLAAGAFIVAAIVLLVVCANVMNILLARGHSRRREMALSAALGASASRLVRQLLMECTVLAGTAGLVGTALSTLGVHLMLRAIPRQGFPGWLTFTVDWRVLAFAFATSVCAMLLFGLLPALEASRVDPIRAIHDGESLGITARSSRAWSARLISVQLALSLVLVGGSTALVAEYRSLLRLAPPYPAERMLELQPVLDEPRKNDLAYQGTHTRAVAEVLRHDANITAVSVHSDAIHVRAAGMAGRYAIGSDVRLLAADDTTRVLWRPQGSWPRVIAVDTAYFVLYRRQLVQGRVFTAADSGGGLPSLVINERLALDAFGTGPVIGQRVRLGARGPVVQIVGVVDDAPRIRLSGGRFFRETPHELFLADAQAETGYSFVTVEARTTVDAASTAARNASQSLDSAMQLPAARTMAENAKRALMPLRYLAAVLSTVAALTLGIAAVGLFALVRYATQQRQREIGIRLALGATPAQVEWLLLRDALRDTRAGLIGGALITAALLSLMMPRLPMGSVVLLQACVMAALVLSAVLLVACWIPARNASRLNPNDVLRRG